jgi:hypothetical protein
MPAKSPVPKNSLSVRRSLGLFYALPVLFVLGLFGYMAYNKITHRGPPVRQISTTPFTTVKIKDLEAKLFAQGDTMRAPGDDLFIEFRDSQGKLVNVGKVEFEMVLNMPNAVMHSIGKVLPTATPGQYRTTVEPGLGGDWTGTIRFSGPQGTAETNFPVKVR